MTAPQNWTPRQVQPASQALIPAGFNSNSDLKPAYLVKECTLKEVIEFIETFALVQLSQQRHYGENPMLTWILNGLQS